MEVSQYMTGTSDGTKLTGMAVSLYKIAEKKADGSWQLMPEYQKSWY